MISERLVQWQTTREREVDSGIWLTDSVSTINRLFYSYELGLSDWLDDSQARRPDSLASYSVRSPQTLRYILRKLNRNAGSDFAFMILQKAGPKKSNKSCSESHLFRHPLATCRGKRIVRLWFHSEMSRAEDAWLKRHCMSPLTLNLTVSIIFCKYFIIIIIIPSISTRWQGGDWVVPKKAAVSHKIILLAIFPFPIRSLEIASSLHKIVY